MSATACGLEALFLVPLATTAEIHRVRLTNTGTTAKSLRLFSFVEFNLWNAFDDQTNYQRNLSLAEVEVEGSDIYHTTEYRERRNHYAVHSVNVPISGFDTDRDTFFGLYNGWNAPNAVVEGRCRNSVASGWAPIGAHQIDIELAPGEQRDLVFVLGYVENDVDAKWQSPGVVNKAPAHRLLDRFRTSEQVDGAMAELRAHWDGLLSTYTVRTRRSADRPDGQHLEPVPVHGHVQHVTQRLVLRDRHRQGHGLSRLEPGSARLRAPRARAGAPSASSTSPPPSFPTAAPTTSTSR